MQNLIIIGAGGFAREVAWLVERINEKKFANKFNLLGFLDDKQELRGKSPGDGHVKVLGPVDSCVDYENALFVCTVGASTTRKKSFSISNRLELRVLPH